MPLAGGYSKKAVGANIGVEMKAGKPRAQSVAIALNTARRAAKKAGARVGYLSRPKSGY